MKWYIQVLGCLLVVALVLGSAAKLLKRKESDNKYSVFYEKAEDLMCFSMGQALCIFPYILCSCGTIMA